MCIQLRFLTAKNRSLTLLYRIIAQGIRTSIARCPLVKAVALHVDV